MTKTGRESIVYLDEKKAVDPIFIDIRNVNSYLDYFLIASGNSQRHCRSLARDIAEFLHDRGLKEIGKHDPSSDWIVLDFGALIVHIFTEELRGYYQLEKLWGDGDIMTLENMEAL